MKAFRVSYLVVAASALVVGACGWDPRRPFEREAPEVNRALEELDAGDAGLHPATEILEDYLATGKCEEGNIGTPPRIRKRPIGSFDLGIALFRLAETYGRRFGDEESKDESGDPNLKGQRAGHVECALRLVRAIADDVSISGELRARARYLEGNLAFLNGNYEEAVRAYDKALEIVPGMFDSGPFAAGDSGRTYDVDPIGRDAAYNRAIALRRIEDKKDAGNDAGDGGDGGDSGQDGGDSGNGDSGGQDSGGDAASQDSGDDEKDAAPPPPKPDEPDAAPPPSKPQDSVNDERMLEQLENAPTVQQENARKNARRRVVRGAADK